MCMKIRGQLWRPSSPSILFDTRSFSLLHSSSELLAILLTASQKGTLHHPAFMWVWGSELRSLFSKLFTSQDISPVLFKFLKKQGSFLRSHLVDSWQPKRGVENERCGKLYTNLFFTISLVLGRIHLSPHCFTEAHTQPAMHTNLLLRHFDWFLTIPLPFHDFLCPPFDRVNSSKC